MGQASSLVSLNDNIIQGNPKLCANSLKDIANELTCSDNNVMNNVSDFINNNINKSVIPNVDTIPIFQV